MRFSWKLSYPLETITQEAASHALLPGSINILANILDNRTKINGTGLFHIFPTW